MVFKKNIWRRKRIAKKGLAKKGKAKSLVTKTQLYRALRRNIETKIATAKGSWTAYNSSIGATGDLQAIIPVIQQGTAQNQRLGVEIRPKKLVIRGYFAFNADAVNNSIYYQQAMMLGARLLVFQDKTTRYYSNSIYNFNLLDDGGSPTSYNGTVINHLLPHNSDQFTFFYDKSTKILKPFGYINSVAPTNANEITSFNTTMFHQFTITLSAKDLPAVFKYDDGASPSNYPLNFAPYMALGYCDLMNKPADTAVTRLAMDWTATLYYEDA